MLNGARPITPEERELVQNFIMSTYDKFLGIVAKERNLPADLLRNTIADGRILSGKEALQNKLIDGLGELDDAFAKAKQLGNAPDAKVVKYGPPFSLFPVPSRFWRIRIENRTATSETTRAATGIGARVFPAELLRSVAVEGSAHFCIPSC
jgi:ClpP class serine protease